MKPGSAADKVTADYVGFSFSHARRWWGHSGDDCKSGWALNPWTYLVFRAETRHMDFSLPHHHVCSELRLGGSRSSELELSLQVRPTEPTSLPQGGPRGFHLGSGLPWENLGSFSCVGHIRRLTCSSALGLFFFFVCLFLPQSKSGAERRRKRSEPCVKTVLPEGLEINCQQEFEKHARWPEIFLFFKNFNQSCLTSLGSFSSYYYYYYFRARSFLGFLSACLGRRGDDRSGWDCASGPKTQRTRRGRR